MGPKNLWIAQNRSERWCFTVPIDAVGIYGKMVELAANKEVVHFIAGSEQGQQTGYRHYQAFVQFVNKKSRNQVKDLLVAEAHLEIAKGSLQDNIKYCSKEGNVQWAVGVTDAREQKRKKKQQNDELWLQILKDAREIDQEQFVERHPKEWVLRRAAIERLMLDSAGEKARKWNGNLQEKNVWIWGPTGTGKSKWANNQAPPGYLLKKNVNKWWCGYNPVKNRVVVIDDYPSIGSGGNCLVHHMKLWADRYPFQGEVKGSTVLVQPGRFCLIITSNFEINQCFNNPEDIAAIERRFHVIQMTKHNAQLIQVMKVNLRKLQGGTEYMENEEENFDWFFDAFKHENEVREAREESMQLREQEEDEEGQQGAGEVEEEW
jgi:hypothetical protein